MLLYIQFLLSSFDVRGHRVKVPLYNYPPVSLEPGGFFILNVLLTKGQYKYKILANIGL